VYVWCRLVKKRDIWWYVVGVILAVGLLGFLIVPFLEFYLHSDVGIHNSSYKLYTQGYPFYIFVLQFFPALIQSSLKSVNNNYWSAMVLFLVVVGLFNKKYRDLYRFFFFVALLAVIKVYSVYFFDWIQWVPIFNNFVYYTYLQPIISLCLAVMACIGLEYFREKGKVVRASVVGLLVLGLSYGYTYLNIGKVNYAFGPKHLYGAILIPLFFLAMYFFLRRWNKRIAFVLLCFFAVFELVAFAPKDRPMRGEPYSKPKYVEFLEKDIEPYRIFSTDQIMYPSTSSVFNVDDIRDLYAVYPRLYISFIKNFIDNSIIDRFSDYGKNTKMVNNVFFDMTNTKYILSYRPIDSMINTNLTEKIIKQNNLDPSALTSFNINHSAKTVLFEHPPASIKYKFTPNKDESFLSFSVGIDPKIWEPKFGEGIRFQINLVNNNQKSQVYNQYIDPKNNQQDRKWFEGKIDLSKFINQEIELELVTSVNNSNAYGWGGWGDLNLGDRVKNDQFTEIYNDEVLIYKNNKSFPRAYVVHEIVWSDDEESTIKEMKLAGFDPRKVAVITSKEKQLVLEQKNNLDKVDWVSQSDSKLVLNTASDSDGYLVISNIFYPGWNVYVDDKKENVYQTDLAFSGLFLPKGNHLVIFRYEPFSYTLGFFVSLSTVGMVLIFWFWQRIKSDRKVEDRK
jgi:hypothetical protein